MAKLSPGETVLGLGSGGGIDVLLSAKGVGPTGRAYGRDMTDEMLALAEEKVATRVSCAVAVPCVAFGPVANPRPNGVTCPAMLTDLGSGTWNLGPRLEPATKMFGEEFVYATVEIKVVLGTSKPVTFIRINHVDDVTFLFS